MEEWTQYIIPTTHISLTWNFVLFRGKRSGFYMMNVTNVVSGIIIREVDIAEAVEVSTGVSI